MKGFKCKITGWKSNYANFNFNMPMQSMGRNVKVTVPVSKAEAERSAQKIVKALL